MVSFVSNILFQSNNCFLLILQIKLNRLGKEVTLDLKIGNLHAYPNGELQFENHDQSKNDFSDKHL